MTKYSKTWAHAFKFFKKYLLILILTLLDCSFPLSIPKVLSVLLWNIDFKDGSFLNSLSQQFSRDNHRVWTNRDISSHSWPMNSRYSRSIPLCRVLFLKK